MDVTKTYKFIGFGAMDVTKTYKFIGQDLARGGARAHSGPVCTWIVLTTHMRVPKERAPPAGMVSGAPRAVQTPKIDYLWVTE